MISIYIHDKEWYEIINPLPNFHSAVVEVWERASNFITLFNRHVVAYIHARIKVKPC